ncbi:uncharacterized protein J3R85_004759 [Psidium guajava]|nr:uncharacterized protein J3R85_004759 [Psidium guajava]
MGSDRPRVATRGRLVAVGCGSGGTLSLTPLSCANFGGVSVEKFWKAEVRNLPVSLGVVGPKNNLLGLPLLSESGHLTLLEMEECRPSNPPEGRGGGTSVATSEPHL